MALSDEVARRKQQLVAKAGEAALRDMVDTLTLSPEERAAREAQRAASNRVLYAKVALAATAVLVALLVLMKVFAALWLYGIALVVLGGLGVVLYFVGRPKLDALRARWQTARIAKVRIQEAAAREAEAARQVEAERQQIEDELARLKRRG
jgi:fatty acid desaturase